MYFYFSEHFNNISENRKLRLLLLNYKIKMVHTMLIENNFLKNNTYKHHD
jgi:hypothetical protein